MTSTADEAAIRKVVEDEVVAWNQGDAMAYSRDFSADGTFTNIRGQFFVGYDGFLRQHDVIFKGIFRNTTLRQDVVSLRFIAPDVGVVETLCTVVGMAETAPGTNKDGEGRLRTRLIQVLVKHGPDWKIAVYHNVDIKAGVPVPDPAIPRS